MPFLGKTPQQFVDPEVDIDGGSIDGTAIGATSASTATVTTFTSTGIDDNATSTAITIDSSQNVGIGTVTPRTPLDTNGMIRTTSKAGAYPADGKGLEIYYEAGGDSGILLSYDRSGSAYKPLRVEGSGLNFYISGTERMRIDSSGRVSINTTASNSQLNLTGTAQALGNAATSRVELITGAHDFWSTPSYSGVLTQYDGTARTGTTYGITNANLGAIRFQNCSNALIGANNGVPLIFATTSAERMRVDSSGNLNIGATSNPLTANAAGKINVLADHGGDCFNMKSTTSGNNMVNLWSTGTTSNVAINFYKGNTQTTVGRIFTSATSTTYSTTSDYRLKENLVSLENATDRLKQIPVHRFNFISDPDTTVDGFLAHEVADVVPEAITGEKDGMKTEEYEITPAVLDDMGNTLEDAVMGTREVPDYQGIDQSKLVPLLTAALQEALTKIDDLETRLSALEAN